MKYFYIFFGLLYHGLLCAQENRVPFLFEKNYVQIDPLYLDYEAQSSDDEQNSQNSKQFLTSRPSALLHFNIQNSILTTTLSLSPNLSRSTGSLALGYLFDQAVEPGLYTLLNHTEELLGSAAMQTGFVRSQFLVGPYVNLFFLAHDSQFACLSVKMGYEYARYSLTSSGITSTSANKRGFYWIVGALYSLALSDKVSLAPGLYFSYHVNQGGGAVQNTASNTQWELIPISLQVPL